MGLATDYCVKYTALDAVGLGLQTTVIVDAVMAVNLNPGDDQRAFDDMKSGGVNTTQSSRIVP